MILANKKGTLKLRDTLLYFYAPRAINDSAEPPLLLYRGLCEHQQCLLRLAHAVLGALGYFFDKVGVPPAPMVLGFVLGPILEGNFRRAMLSYRGGPHDFHIQRPISAILRAVSPILLAIPIFPAIRAKREQSLQE